jgi:hypothetical protein
MKAGKQGMKVGKQVRKAGKQGKKLENQHRQTDSLYNRKRYGWEKQDMLLENKTGRFANYKISRSWKEKNP